jgi:DNA-binding beta-propeller fold protein YncE
MVEILLLISALGRGSFAKSVTFRHYLEDWTMVARSDICRRVQLRKAVPQLRAALTIVLCFLLSLLISACTAPILDSKPVHETGAFNLFLQPLPQETHRLSFAISALTAVRENGEDISLKILQPAITSEVLTAEQQKLVSVNLPPGRYTGVRLQVDKASLQGEEGSIALASPADPIMVEYAFSIVEKQAETLFLSLSADRLVTDGAFFTPKFSLWKPERMLTNLKGFVSNSGSQYLTVFNKRSAQVTNLIMVGKTPKDMALDRRRGWLYVALTDENLIAVVEVSNGNILGQIRLRFNDEPTELALSASSERLLALNHGSRTVSVIDTASLVELGRVKLTSTADDIFMGRNEDVGYVIHTVSSTLSVIDLNSMAVRSSTILDDAPIKGVVSKDGKDLYLITDSSADLMVTDSSSLSVRRKIFVGSGARSIVLSGVSSLLYIGKRDGEIAVVDPRALMAIDSYRLPGPVQSLAIDYEENTLFALLPQSRHLLKIDLVSRRLIGRLELESAGHTVLVMGGK